MSRRENCSRCLYTTKHPLGLLVDEEGICSGCRVHEEKDWIDWASRWTELQDLVRQYRSQSGNTYDCIVPVTGGGDSFFIMHVVKERLGLNPLAVTYNHQFNTDVGCRNLARLRQVFDVTLRQMTVNPVNVRRLVKATLIQFGSVYWHAIAGQTVFPVQTAIETGIPLIVWGAHQGMEQVGMFSHLDGVEMSRRYRKEHDLMGYEADDLLLPYSELRERDIWQFRYPDDSELLATGVRGIYLSNFLRWDPSAQNREMADTHGFRGAHLPGTFDTYDHVDSLVYMGYHDHLKMMKHGYGKITDQLVREIRHGRISRPVAFRLATQQAAIQVVPWIRIFADWLGATEKGLLLAADKHRSPQVWSRNGLSWVARESQTYPDVSLGAATSRQIEALLEIMRLKDLDFQNVEDTHFKLFDRGYPN